MNKELIDYIKRLSNNDPKNLSQKVAKLFEEGGELAKKSLPYENAHGTRHRFPSRDGVLEEVADVILVALSIGYHLDMTDDELETILLEKSKYWNEIQNRESKTFDGKFPFEIHVTVDREKFNFERFKTDCKELGIKPLKLKNYSGENDNTETVTMANAIITGSGKDALDSLNNICNELKLDGYTILREKIETVPWHPAAGNIPKSISKNPNVFYSKDDSEIFYFEIHFKIRAIDGDEGITAIKNGFKNITSFRPKDMYGISWNAEKEAVDGIRTYFATYRGHNKNLNDFKNIATSIHDKFNNTENIIEASSENIEFCVYDSAEYQDKIWINSIV